MKPSAVNFFRILAGALAFAASTAFALTFSSDYRVSSVSGSSQQPRITGEIGTNNLHLTWVEYFPGNVAQIYYARSTDNGSSWEAARALTSTPDNKMAPSVAAFNGSVVIAWNTDFNTGGIQYVRSADHGVSFTTPATLWDSTGYSRNPELVVDQVGNYTLAWYDSANSGGLPVGHIFVSLSCNGGASWAGPQDISAVDGSVDSEMPQLAVDSNNILWLTYRSTRNGEPQGGWSPYQQYLTRRTAFTCGTGQSFLWPPAPISPGLPDYLTSVYGGTIITGAGSRIHVAYWDNNAGNNIGFRTGTLANGFSVPVNASQEGPNNPQITAGNSDVGFPGMAQDTLNSTVHLVWFEETNVAEGFKVGNLKYQTITNLSATTPTLGGVTTLVNNNLTMTPKALYFGGRIHVVWSDYRNVGTSAEIYHKYANEDGSVSSAPAVSLSETAYLFPNTAAGGGTSAAHSFTLTNTGNAALSIFGILASAEYAQTNNCPASLAPTAACTINATFSPAAVGVRPGTITISDNGSGNPHTITLSGTGDDANTDTDGDGMPNGVEFTLGFNPSIKDNDIFGNPTLFAMQQYRDFLSREGDSAGINFWANQIASGGTTRGQCVENFFNSAEFQQTAAPVVRLYFAYFNRIPDYAGLTFWINYQKQGHSLDEISNFFAGSAEFQSTYGSLTNGQYVNLVYQNVLGRAPDAAGYNFWVNQLDTASMTRGQVMRNFSESSEYQSVSYRNVYVTMMYVGMLRRSPDQAGFNFWVGYMANNPGLALINGFLTSTEYHNRFLP